MIGIGDQVLYVLSWLAVIKLLQLSTWPLIRPLLGRLAYPAAYTTSLLLFLLGSFYLGLVHLPTWLIAVPFLALLGIGVAKRQYGRTEWEGVAKWDLVFLVFFLFVLELRFFNPYVSHYSEQFMDMAWLAAIMRNPVVTPADPWFAGGTLDIYYYLGHWLMAQLGLVAGVPARVVFNLVLPTVMAAAAVNCYLIGHILLERYRWLPIGLLVLVNPTALYQLAIGTALIPALDRSRHAIEHGLTEYPLYSMILGDPHALVMSMINQLFLIALLAFAWTRWQELSSRQRWMLMGLSALSLGAMAGINSWDVLIYGPVVVILGLLLWQRARRTGSTDAREALAYPAVVPAAGLALALPYLLAVQPGSVHGVLPVISPSEPVSFLLSWGFFFAVIGVAIARQVPKQAYLLIVAIPFALLGYYSAAIAAVLLAFMLLRARRTGRFEDLAVIAGLSLILFVEILYFREIFDNEYFRTNTMHKLYYIAWLMLGVGCAGLVGRWLGARPGPLLHAPAARAVVAAVAIAALLAFPIAFQPDVGKGLLGIHFGGGDRTLDGLAYLDYAHPADAEAVRFLEGYTGARGIVEAVGDDYSYGAPISSFTGIPTVIGKRSHELQWRTNSDGWWWTRIPDVERCYEDPAQTVAVMEKYRCDLLYVGDLERKKYSVNLTPSGLTKVYDRNGVQIYRLAQAS